MSARPKPSKQTSPTSPADLSFEDAITDLESIIERIESGEIGIEDSVKAYERGIALRRRCDAILAQAQQRITELTVTDSDAVHDASAE